MAAMATPESLRLIDVETEKLREQAERLRARQVARAPDAPRPWTTQDLDETHPLPSGWCWVFEGGPWLADEVAGDRVVWVSAGGDLRFSSGTAAVPQSVALAVLCANMGRRPFPDRWGK